MYYWVVTWFKYITLAELPEEAPAAVELFSRLQRYAFVVEMGFRGVWVGPTHTEIGNAVATSVIESKPYAIQ